jgi:hypothetical protein
MHQSQLSKYDVFAPSGATMRDAAKRNAKTEEKTELPSETADLWKLIRGEKRGLPPPQGVFPGLKNPVGPEGSDI